MNASTLAFSEAIQAPSLTFSGIATEGFYFFPFHVVNLIADLSFLLALVNSELYTASTDKTAAVWDMETGARVKRFKGHTAIVNSVGLSRRGTDLVCTASDDGTIKVCRFIADLHFAHSLRLDRSFFRCTYSIIGT